MKRFLILLTTAIIGVVTVPASASIRLKIADSASIHTALGKHPDSLWFRKAAYEAIKDGTVPLVDPDSTYWVDSIDTRYRPNPFADIIDSNLSAPQNKYMVVGTADNFVVPATGTYTFEIRGNYALFVFIDGKLLQDEDGKAFLYEGLNDPLHPQKGNNGYPEVSVGTNGFQPGYLSTVTLDSGFHTFEFFYYEKSGFSFAQLFWKTPGSNDKVVVPAKTFPPRKNYGPLKIRTVNWKFCPYTIYKGQCPHLAHIDVQAYCGVAPDDTVYFYWDFFDKGKEDEQLGIVDIITTNTYIETLLVCESMDTEIHFQVWAYIGDRRSPNAEGGLCNALYCSLDECSPIWKDSRLALYAQCREIADGDCSEGKNIHPSSDIIQKRCLQSRLFDNAKNKGTFAVYAIAGRKLNRYDIGRWTRKKLPTHGVYLLKFDNAVRPEMLVKIAR